MKKALYFSYGSALDERTPGTPAWSVHAALLRGYRLPDHGSTLVRDKLGAVRGTLVPMPVTVLDRLEGEDGWLRTLRQVRAADGKRRKAWVYLQPATWSAGDMA